MQHISRGIRAGIGIAPIVDSVQIECFYTLSKGGDLLAGSSALLYTVYATTDIAADLAITIITISSQQL
jgi:hypothetical protein